MSDTMEAEVDHAEAAEDAAHLEALGYESHFKRELKVWSILALGFTYLSPVVGIYSLYSYAIDTAGPPALWTLLIAGGGQFLVALVFAEVVSQYPIAGGIYPWARRLVGRKYAWMNGWMYAWALLITIGAVAYGAGPFAGELFGVEPTVNWTIGTALVLLAVAGAVNFSGTKNLSRVARLGFFAELLGVLGVGLILILFFREQSPTVVFHTYGAVSGTTFLGAFFAAGLIALYAFYGFEACGDVAEEVSNPGRRIPRAMQLTVITGVVTAFFLMLAFTLAIPNMDEAVNGEAGDLVTTIFENSLGSTGTRIFMIVVLISFLSCVLSLQAAVSRMVYSYGRDRMIFGHRMFGAFSDKLGIPPGAMATAVLIPAIVVLISKISEDALVKIISFATIGIYIAFQGVVLAALIARMRGWRPAGKWSLGKWGIVVNFAALAYGVSAMVNMAWPRTPDASWVDNYIVLIGVAIVAGVGLIYMALGRPYRHSDAPEGDAIEMAEKLRALQSGRAAERSGSDSA